MISQPMNHKHGSQAIRRDDDDDGWLGGGGHWGLEERAGGMKARHT